MFFSAKKYIVLISQNKLTLSQVSLGKKPKVKTLGQYDWTKDSLTQVLMSVKKTTSGKLRILLSEDLAYVVSVAVDEATSNERSAIQNKAQIFIPEHLDKTVWDFKEMLELKSDLETNRSIVQVVAIKETTYTQLRESIASCALEVEAIEPISYALSRLTSGDKTPHLILHMMGPTIMVASYLGLVIATESLDTPPNEDKLKEFIQFIKEHSKLDIKRVYVSGNSSQVDTKKFASLGVEIKIQNLDPFIGLALKKDLAGRDEKVLNLEISRFRKPQVLAKKSRQRGLFLLLGLLLIGGIAVASYFFFWQKPQQKKTPEKVERNLTPTKKPEQKVSTPTATLDLRLHPITILNGSGIVGEATKLETLLTDEGFTIVETGNADRYDYQETLVRSKATIEDSFIKALDKILESVYTSIEHQELSATDEADIIITIGI